MTDPTETVTRLLLERKATPRECAELMMSVSGIAAAYPSAGTLEKATTLLAAKYGARIGALDAIRIYDLAAVDGRDRDIAARAVYDALKKMEEIHR